MTEPTFRIIETNGVKIRAAVQGEGPLVVMVHGFPESWYSYRHQMAPLAAAGFTACAIDVRGYGGSDKPHPVDEYSFEALTADVVRGVRRTELMHSDRAGAHLMMDVIRLADRQRDDRQGRIARPGARELTAITDEQVLEVVRLTPPVANSIRPVGAHPARAHVVAVGKRRAPYDVFRISGVEDRFHGVAGML